MKKVFFFTLFAVLFCISVYSQDTIVRTNGRVILCDIQREDSVSVYFNFTEDYKVISTFLQKSNISAVKYGPLQENDPIPQEVYYYIDKSSLGFGFGLENGGLGGSLIIYPQRNIGLFGGVGYALAGMGYNAGVKLRMISEPQGSGTNAFLLAMYGYNAAIAIENAPDLNKLFYGPSFGFGVDYKSKPSKEKYWSFSLSIPIRDPEVNNYMDDLTYNNGVEFKGALLPFTISISYRIILDQEIY